MTVVVSERDRESDLQRVARLWCLPQHSHKEMDVEFAKDIVALIAQVREETRAATVDAAKTSIQELFKSSVNPNAYGAEMLTMVCYDIYNVLDALLAPPAEKGKP